MRKTLFVPLVAVVGLVAVACVTPTPPTPDPTPEILAVAYSNLDGVDGYDESGTDVLIAKVVDDNLDDAVSVGDSVVTDQYPLDHGATGFASFQNTTHTITMVNASSPSTILVDSIDGAFTFQKVSGYEYFVERGSGANCAAGECTAIQDRTDTAYELLRVYVGAPSQAETGVDLTRDPGNPLDEGYLDLDILI